MAGPLLGFAKAYLGNKARNYAKSKLEDAIGLPRDSISAVTDPTGFAKNIVQDVAQSYGKDAFFGKNEIPVEDRVPALVNRGGTNVGKSGKLEAIENMEWEGDYKRGGKVKSASRRGDGIAKRGKTRGRMV